MEDGKLNRREVELPLGMQYVLQEAGAPYQELYDARTLTSRRVGLRLEILIWFSKGSLLAVVFAALETQQWTRWLDALAACWLY